MSEEGNDLNNAKRIHQNVMVIDGHCDTILEIANKKINFGKRNTKGHLDIPRLQEGGVNVQVFAIFIEDIYKPDRALKRTLQLYDIFYQELMNLGLQLFDYSLFRQNSPSCLKMESFCLSLD